MGAQRGGWCYALGGCLIAFFERNRLNFTPLNDFDFEDRERAAWYFQPLFERVSAETYGPSLDFGFRCYVVC